MAYWKQYFTAPYSVDRPKQNDLKGVFDIRGHKSTDFKWKWLRIIEATINGLLGHYSGFSPEGNRICVASQTQTKKRT